MQGMAAGDRAAETDKQLRPRRCRTSYDLIVNGSGKAARTWRVYDVIVAALRRFDYDETRLIQSGKPVGVFQTRGDPRVLFVNALLVPAWTTWDTFRGLEDRDLTMYGQMTAKNWIYTGTFGILQGTYKSFAAAAHRHSGSTFLDPVVLTAGLSGMGGARPLAATMDGGATLVVEVDRRHIERSIALEANEAEVLPEILQRDVILDVVTDQTSAYDALNGCVPHGMSLAEAAVPREPHVQQYIERSIASMARHVEAILAFRARGTVTFDCGNNIREQAPCAGAENAFDIPGFVPEYERSLPCEGEVHSAGPRSREIPTTFA